MARFLNCNRLRSSMIEDVDCRHMLFLTVLIVVPADAAWERRVCFDGCWTDTPQPHSLAYFKASACPAQGLKDRLGDCLIGDRTELVFISRAGPFAVFDFNYYVDQDNFEGRKHVEAKSILIQIATGSFREIYHYSLREQGATLHPTRVFTADGHRILVTKYEDGGMYHGFAETFFTLRSNGIGLMHPERVFEAGDKGLPAGQVPWTPSSNFDFSRHEWSIAIGPEGKVSKAFCCPDLMTVKFKIENGDFVPGGVSIRPIKQR